MYNAEELDNKWIAVRVRTLCERLTAEYLSMQDYECFVPLRFRNKSSSDVSNKGIKPEALFPGYLFCKFKTYHAIKIVQAPWVIKLIGSNGSPSIIPEEEMNRIFKIVNSEYNTEPYRYVTTGQMVKIKSGSLSGIKGVLMNMNRTSRVIVGVPLLMRSIAVTIDRSNLSFV